MEEEEREYFHLPKLNWQGFQRVRGERERERDERDGGGGEWEEIETNLLFRLRFNLNDKAVFVICLLSKLLLYCCFGKYEL